jgi:hypothetical protein
MLKNPDTGGVGVTHRRDCRIQSTAELGRSSVKKDWYRVDTLELLREKVERAVVLGAAPGVNAVLKHLQMAERHFDEARRTGEDELFTDVIYRANQVYEGMLREGYAVFAGQGAKKGLKTYELESYLKDNHIFKDRVVGAMEHYRQKWRNPSTHEHVTSFVESEALMALLSVTSFAALLLDQLVDSLVFTHEAQEMEKELEKVQANLERVRSEPLVDRLSFVLPDFGHRLTVSLKSELEVVAQLRAYLTTVLPDAVVEEAPSFSDQQGIVRPDLYIREGKETAVVEVKRYKAWSQREQQSALEQMHRYLAAADANSAFLVAVPVPGATLPDGHSRGKQIVHVTRDGRPVVEVVILPVVS